MLKIAYFSPLNPVKSGISDYSEELLPYLAQKAEPALFVDGYQPTNPEIIKNFPIYDVRRLDPKDHLSDYDITLYHMGNSPAHAYIYTTLLEWPGVVVLHDYSLHSMHAALFLECGQPQRYVEEMRYCHGREGVLLAREVLTTPGFHLWDKEPLRYPLNKRVIDHAQGVIVHSHFVRNLLRVEHPFIPVRKINHHVLPEEFQEVTEAERAALQRKYGIPSDAVVVGSFGYINADKRLEQILEALSLLKDFFPLFCLFVGETLIDLRHLEELVEKRGLTDRVRWIGLVDVAGFREMATLTDICLNLRYPHRGETSGALCRLLGAGKPCVVSDVGWFRELPDSCVVKVDADAHEIERLAHSLWELIINEPLRQQIGQNARTYARTHHRIEDAARGYLEFCQEVLDREERQVEFSLAGECAEVLSDIGVGKGDGNLLEGLEEILCEVAGSQKEGVGRLC